MTRGARRIPHRLPSRALRPRRPRTHVHCGSIYAQNTDSLLRITRGGSEKLEWFVFVCLFFSWTVPRENAARASSARWFRPDGSGPWPIQRLSCSIRPTIRVGKRSGRMRQKETDPRGLPAPGGCQRIFRIPIPGITQQVSYCVLCSTRITKKKKERTSLHVACERCGAFVLKVVPQNASNYTGKRGGPFSVIYSNLNSQ